jgi:hypothetical protein
MTARRVSSAVRASATERDHQQRQTHEKSWPVETVAYARANI